MDAAVVIEHPRNGVVCIISFVSVLYEQRMYVCMSDDNARQPWRGKFIFAQPVYRQRNRIRVKFVYEGHWVKVKVTGAEKVENLYFHNGKLRSHITPPHRHSPDFRCGGALWCCLKWWRYFLVIALFFSMLHWKPSKLTTLTLPNKKSPRPWVVHLRNYPQAPKFSEFSPWGVRAPSAPPGYVYAPPSLSTRTHSRVVSLRVEGNLVD